MCQLAVVSWSTNLLLASCFTATSDHQLHLLDSLEDNAILADRSLEFPQLRQCLYFWTSKASKLSTSSSRGSVASWFNTNTDGWSAYTPVSTSEKHGVCVCVCVCVCDMCVCVCECVCVCVLTYTPSRTKGESVKERSLPLFLFRHPHHTSFLLGSPTIQSL